MHVRVTIEVLANETEKSVWINMVRCINAFQVGNILYLDKQHCIEENTN